MSRALTSLAVFCLLVSPAFAEETAPPTPPAAKPAAPTAAPAPPTTPPAAKPVAPSTAPAAPAPATAPAKAAAPAAAPAAPTKPAAPAAAAATTGAPSGAAIPPAPDAEPVAAAPQVRGQASGLLDKSFMLGVHLGMGFPQPFSQLRNFGVYELELGYLLPTWGRRLQLGVMASYSSPGSGNGQPDSRLGAAGDDFRFDLSQKELVLELNFTVRAFPLGRFLNAYGKVGFRVYLLDTEINGAAVGSNFGQYNETFTEPGFMVGGGLEVRLGPGAFNAELRIDYSSLNRMITGDSNTGMLTLLLGYRVFL